MRAALYTRISKDFTGEKAGVERQLHACTALADRLGWDVVATFSDNDISAYRDRRRPGFEKLLTAMKNGEFSALIVWHVDRLYRSMKDLERLIDVAETAGVQFQTVTSGNFDLSTSAGKMIARILGSVARQESEHHAERRKEANLERAAAGKWCATGSRPFGYDATGTPIEPEAALLRRAAAEILAGRSLHSIAAEWNQAGHTTVRGAAWTNLHLRRVLMNPRLAALRVHQDKVIGPGAWTPILDEETWRGLRSFLSDPARRNGLAFERKHTGSGIYRCGICGGPMYATYPHGKGTAMLYACRPTSHVARLGAPLDAYIEKVLLKYLSSTDIHLLLHDGRKVDVGGLHTRRAALAARADELATLFAQGAINGSQLRRGTSELQTQLADIDSQLAELARRNPVADLLDTGEAVEKCWAALSPDMRGKIVDELMTVTVSPTPRGVKGVTIESGSRMRIIDPDYIDITWKRS